MLRHSLTLTARRLTSRSAVLSRFNSTRPTIPGLPESVGVGNSGGGPSVLTAEDLQEELKSIREDIDEDFEFADASDIVEPPIRDPQKIAQTETELFGTSSTIRTAPAPINDAAFDIRNPDHLPRRIKALSDLGPNFTEEQYASALIHGRAVYLPFQAVRTHSVPVATIQFRSHHPRYLDLFTHFAAHAASSLGIPFSRTVALPTKRTLWTVLRSPFAYKKSQENFERRVHKRLIKAWDADEEVVERWMKYLRKHQMGGVGMRMVKWERKELGVGGKVLEGLVDRLNRPSAVPQERIKEMGERIVKEEMTQLVEGDGVHSEEDAAHAEVHVPVEEVQQVANEQVRA